MFVTFKTSVKFLLHRRQMLEGFRMGPISFLLAVFLVSSCKGSRAQTPVFVKTGGDLHLEVKEADVPEDYDDLTWLFNKTIILVKLFSSGKDPRVPDRYSGRIEVSMKNFSVKLKNLQKSDSGVYAAQVTTDKINQLSRYSVTVIDPVSPVKLTVDSVTNSSDSCDLTVTCRSLDSHQISISTNVTCNTTTCSQEGGERSKVTTSGATLHVYLDNYKIICNHSNQVSWTNDSMMIDQFYPRHTDPEPLCNHITPAVVGVGVGVLVLGLFAVVGFAATKKTRKSNKEKAENTGNAYEAEPGQPVDQSQTNDASGPTTTYDVVGTHNEPTRSTETRGNSLPENPYAEAEAAPGSGPESNQ